MDNNLGGRDYDQDIDLEYEDDWQQERMAPPSRYTYHSYPMMQRPMPTVRLAPLPGGPRRLPIIISRKATPVQSRSIHQQHPPILRHQYTHPMRMAKTDHSRDMMEGESSSQEAPYLVPYAHPYANEETVRTSEEQQEEDEEVETGMDHSIKRLEDDLDVDVEGVSDGNLPSTSMPKMIVRPRGVPVFHPAENKAVIENYHLKARLQNLIDSNVRFRDEVSQLREEKRELLKQFRKQEKVIEKQSVELAEAETVVADLRRREKEKDKKYERELALKDKRKKAITVMPCLPNRKVIFSKATKQAQSLRLRLLHRYLGELCGPVDGEHRLEEKNLIVLRWRKAHAPKPSLEIGRQLLPKEEEEFCHRFGIVGDRKKEMKRWLGHKHIDLFGPSERAIAVRKWRMGQREKKRRGEKVDEMIIEEEILDEVGNDTDDDELMDDIEKELEKECGGGGEKSANDSTLSTHIIDEDDDDEEVPILEDETR